MADNATSMLWMTVLSEESSDQGGPVVWFGVRRLGVVASEVKEVQTRVQPTASQVHRRLKKKKKKSLQGLRWQGSLSHRNQFNTQSASEAFFGKSFGRTVFRYVAGRFPWRTAVLRLNCQESRPHASKYKLTLVFCHAPRGIWPHFGWLCGLTATL